MELRIVRRPRRSRRTSILVRAPRPGRSRAAGAFTAGAHVAVTSPNGCVRKYSLCNDPADRDRYLIAVKRDPGEARRIVDLVDNTRVAIR